MKTTDVKGASREAVNHPAHYAAHYRREVIELTGLFDFTTGNSMKYVLRCRFKAHPAEDLQKALWYLNYFADHPEVGFENPRGASEVLGDFLADLGTGEPFGREAGRFLKSLVRAVETPPEDKAGRAALLREASLALQSLLSHAAQSL